MTQNKTSERTQPIVEQSQNLKITRDPVTGYAMVELFNQSIVLKKDVSVSDLYNKPVGDVMECVL